MEKINREELMKKLELTEEDLEKVAGGTSPETQEEADCLFKCVIEWHFKYDECLPLCVKQQ